MFELLKDIDTQLLLFFNSHHNAFFDSVFWYASGTKFWIPLYVAILATSIIKYRKKSWLVILSLIVLIALSDQMASGIIKPLVERLRPSREPSLIGLIHIVNGYKGGLYGFVSSHAANTFALAVFSSQLFKHKAFTWSIIIWASIVSYSRIYLGVHYPGDILGGIIVGIGSAFLVYYLFKVLEQKLKAKDEKN
jgi:undecaprenyl-diphosphatase